MVNLTCSARWLRRVARRSSVSEAKSAVTPVNFFMVELRSLSLVCNSCKSDIKYLTNSVGSTRWWCLEPVIRQLV